MTSWRRANLDDLITLFCAVSETPEWQTLQEQQSSQEFLSGSWLYKSVAKLDKKGIKRKSAS